MCPEAERKGKEPDCCKKDMQSQGEKMMNESEIEVKIQNLEARVAALESNSVTSVDVDKILEGEK